MSKFFSMIGRRMREPSTWSAIAALLGGFGILEMQAAATVAAAGQEIAQATSGSDIELNLGIIGGGVSAIIAAVLPEKYKK